MNKIGLVIPNWNGEKNLKFCLNSIKKQTYKNFEVFIVDNGSKDESVQIIKGFSDFKLIELKENTGFAKASNIGIRAALKDKNIRYVCPLNNDIKLDKNYLAELVELAQELDRKKVKLGILAAKLYFKNQVDLLNTTGTLIQRDGSGMEKAFKVIDKGQYKKTVEIFGSCGAAALYTKKMLQEISFRNSQGENCYFDEDFFAYYEDLDLNYRSRLMGYKAYFCPKAIGYHVHSATGVSFSGFKSFYVHRNQYYVLIKNFPFPFLVLGFLMLPFRYFLLVISAVVRKGPSAELKKNVGGGGLVKIVLKSWIGVVKNVKPLCQKRKIIQRKRKVSLKTFNSWFKKYKASYKKMIFYK
ncbi:MAG: glycosyltransferase [Candidatus Moranbacteria bacterium]|nr:glycosyltransferase [Candidatus Moranbacteria bacterium]